METSDQRGGWVSGWVGGGGGTLVSKMDACVSSGPASN